MPTAYVAKLAKEQGISVKQAEKKWEQAKLLAGQQGRNPDTTKQSDDYAYTTSIFKSLMHKKKSTNAESLIDRVLEGERPKDVLQILLAGSVARLPVTEGSIGTGERYVPGEQIGTFFDGEGELRFYTENEVLIDPSSDKRMLELMQYADALDVDNPLFDLLEDYEGTLEDLYKTVTNRYTLIHEI